MKLKPRSFWMLFVWAAGCFGITERLAIEVLSGNRAVGPFSGVGDQDRYRTLAESIYGGHGFSYAGQPTGLRAPVYPYVMSFMHVVFGSHYFGALRALQFCMGIVVAYLCFLIAAHFFGRQTGFVAAAIALCLPTLVFITAELQTECFATVFTTLFLFLLLALEPTDRYAILLGLAAGLAALTRFNAALLPIMGMIVCYWKTRTLRFSLTLCAVTGIVLAPWIIRNAEVFDGKILYSSHGGINQLEGVLTPQGRAQNGEDERVRTAVGWLHSDIETNDAHRLNFPSEDVLDSEARTAAARVWSQLKWQAGVKLLGGKIMAFWLSTDQLYATTSFSRVQRLMRTGGVVAYWIVLVFAARGWRALYNVNRSAAFIVAFYFLFITLAHLPFVMNTRLRIPFFDPLLATLAAGGLPIAEPINNVLKVHTVESVADHA